jgi:GTP-binding protein
MLNIVAIVGRPNVGKSTLFNRLCRKRKAIVDPEAGITRDRKYETTEWNGHHFIVVDTGGIIPRPELSMDQAIRDQAVLAANEADLVIFLVDAYTGVTDADLEIARILDSHREKVLLVANKADNEKLDLDLYDFLQLGYGEAFPISAAQGRNTGNFLDAILDRLTFPIEEQVEPDEDAIRIVIAGRPNVGKSSLVNRLVGSDVVIVDNIPGTTRDSIDTVFRYHGRKFVLVDTAGLRKKTKVEFGVEYFSTMRSIESIRDADLVIIVMDAELDVSTQDQRIASFAARHYRDVLIVVNKWDLIPKETATSEIYVKRIRKFMPFMAHAPVLFTSALTGQRVRKLPDAILDIDAESHKRISTGQLNQFLADTMRRLPPTHPNGKHVKIRYCTQVAVHPPNFVFFCNDAKLVTDRYRRYLHNQLRETFGFKGATIKLQFRGRDDDRTDFTE